MKHEPLPMSERRLAENEMIFRRMNERINQDVEAVSTLAKEDHQPEYAASLLRDDLTLQFLCECADEKCLRRIPVALKAYLKIHARRDCFVVVPGHEVPSVERVVQREKAYSVVQKLLQPPPSADKLHPTTLGDS